MKERENATPWIFCIGNYNVDAELVDEREREKEKETRLTRYNIDETMLIV